MNVLALMKNYFDEGQTHCGLVLEAPGNALPIAPKKQTWERTENPESLQRVFELSSVQHLIYFLEDVIQLQEELKHHGKLLVDGNRVLVQISTHTLNQVTELDIEWAAKVDEIYDDVESAK